MDFETSARNMTEQMNRCLDAYNDLVEAMKEVKKCADGFERMKSCANCDHSDVCVVVHDRKRRQAGDYTPCSKWKLVEK